MIGTSSSRIMTPRMKRLIGLLNDAWFLKYILWGIAFALIETEEFRKALMGFAFMAMVIWDWENRWPYGGIGFNPLSSEGVPQKM